MMNEYGLNSKMRDQCETMYDFGHINKMNEEWILK